MNTLLVIVIVVLAGLAVVSLVRGIVAFLQNSKIELERDPAAGPSENQLLQNKMMFARIKYQLAAVVVVAILLLMNR